MATFYALRLGNGAWLDKGGSQKPTEKIVTDLQNAQIYNSISTAKMQQTEFIKNRNRFPNNPDFQEKCEVIKLEVTGQAVAVGDSMGQEVPAAKRFNPNIDTSNDSVVSQPDMGGGSEDDGGSLSNLIRKGVNRAKNNRNNIQ